MRDTNVAHRVSVQAMGIAHRLHPCLISGPTNGNEYCELRPPRAHGRHVCRAFSQAGFALTL